MAKKDEETTTEVLTEVNGMTAEENEAEAKMEQEVRAAFDAAVDAGKDEDSVKMEMIAAGAKFKNVTRMYNQFMVDAGLVVSKEEKVEVLDSTLEGKDLTQEDVFNEAVTVLMDKLGVSERSAAGSLRQWAKKNEVEFYKKPAGSTGGGRSGITSKILDFIVANPTASKDELIEHLKEVGTENTMKHQTLYVNILEAANKIADKYAA